MISRTRKEICRRQALTSAIAFFIGEILAALRRPSQERLETCLIFPQIGDVVRNEKFGICQWDQHVSRAVVAAALRQFCGNRTRLCAADHLIEEEVIAAQCRLYNGSQCIPKFLLL